VQHIAALAATPHGDDGVTNTAGFRHSVTFGFGILNVTRMMELATGWTPVGGAVRLSIASPGEPPPSGSEIVISIHVTGCDDHGERDGQAVCIARLEHVQLVLSLKSTKARGQLDVLLTAPTGTVSRLLWPRAADTIEGVSLQWTFLTVAHWGETPAGTWVARIRSFDGGDVSLSMWQLVLHGTADYNSGGTRSINATNPGRLAPSSHPNYTLPNGCVVCGLQFFWDGDGGCRPCDTSCAHGCTAPGPEFCIDLDNEDGVAGTGFGHTEIGSWFFDVKKPTAKKIALGIGVSILVLLAVMGVRRVWVTLGPSAKGGTRTRAGGGDGAVALLSPEGADLAEHEVLELDTLDHRDATARAAASYITIAGVSSSHEDEGDDGANPSVTAWGSPLPHDVSSPPPAVATTSL